MQENTTLTQRSEALRFEVMTAEQFFDQAVELLIEQSKELTTDRHLMKLNPDFAKYYELDHVGALIVLGVYRGSQLVGFSANIITNNLHYADLRYCQNDVLFLTKSERKGSAGLRLIRKTEEMARLEGAKIMLWHAKPGTTLDKLLPRMGASVQDVVYKVNL